MSIDIFFIACPSIVFSKAEQVTNPGLSRLLKMLGVRLDWRLIQLRREIKMGPLIVVAVILLIILIAIVSNVKI